MTLYVHANKQCFKLLVLVQTNWLFLDTHELMQALGESEDGPPGGHHGTRLRSARDTTRLHPEAPAGQQEAHYQNVRLA